jgi:deoxyribonuclease V
MIPQNITPVEAISLQKELRKKIGIEKLNKNISTIAGADVSFNKYEDVVYAGIIVLSFPELNVMDHATVVTKASFPYIPGLLSFREIPSLLQVFNKLKTKPDIVMVDGHGICHPRRLGIATHFGLLIDTPTIGAAKNLLIGSFEEPEAKKGNHSYIYDKYNKNEKIGAAVITKDKVKPMIVSPGHKINIEQSIDIVLKCSVGHRLPEPTRQAHILVNNERMSADLSSPPQNPLF